jgi:dihydroxyacetone kinase-like predicted kinase
LPPASAQEHWAHASPGIAYLDGPRLRRALTAAVRRTHSAKGELNRINVYSRPDGDTGTNLA